MIRMLPACPVGIVSLLAFSFFHCVATAQDASVDGPKLAFEFPKIAEPADPDPAEQSDEERLRTLRKRMREAVALIEKGDLESFVSDYIDPFWIARYAAGEKVPVEEMFVKMFDEGRSADRILEIFKETLKGTLEREPQFLLGGRAAGFMDGHESRTAEFWIYIDGKWRISPET